MLTYVFTYVNFIFYLFLTYASMRPINFTCLFKFCASFDKILTISDSQLPGARPDFFRAHAKGPFPVLVHAEHGVGLGLPTVKPALDLILVDQVGLRRECTWGTWDPRWEIILTLR